MSNHLEISRKSQKILLRLFDVIPVGLFYIFLIIFNHHYVDYWNFLWTSFFQSFFLDCQKRVELVNDVLTSIKFKLFLKSLLTFKKLFKFKISRFIITCDVNKFPSEDHQATINGLIRVSCEVFFRNFLIQNFARKYGRSKSVS